MVEVSVVITAFNYNNYVSRCIESCQNQITKIPFEVIVIDDGSSDGTYETSLKYNTGNTRVIQTANGGIEKASNLGIHMAHGNYVVRVDADDKLTETYVEEMTKVMKETRVDFAYSDYFVLDGNELVVSRMFLPEFNSAEIYGRGDFLATGTMFRRESYEKVNYYSELVKNCGLENYELILKLLKWGAVGKRVAQPLFYYRRHASNISVLRRDAIIAYGGQLFKKMNLGEYRTNEFHPYSLIL